jgi:predicted dehydrogenase
MTTQDAGTAGAALGIAARRGAGPVGVGIVGAGNVSDQYLTTMAGYPDLHLAGIADLDVGRAKVQAQRYGLPFAGSVSELLGLASVEVVVNLTIPAAHAEVALAAIESGRHVWGEKPLAADRASARTVLAAAQQAGVVVGNAPDTILGAGIQGSQRLLRTGTVGTPKTVLTLMQGPGPDRWHPRPQFLFQPGAGPLFDIGPYYVSTLVQLLGPITTVFAAGNRARSARIVGSGADAGTSFPVEVDTHVSVVSTFESGVIGTSVYSFDSAVSRQRFEIYGDAGAMEVPVSGFNGPTRVLRADAPDAGWSEIMPAGEARDRGVGVLEMARAIRAGELPRASGQLALHVLDVLLAIEESAVRGEPVSVESTTGPVAPLDAAWSATAATLPAEGTAR